jgi:hypothetical protein
MNNRREFLKKSVLTTAGLSLGSGLLGKTLSSMAGNAATEPMIGIQMGAHSFYDEGMEKVLDFLSQKAAINTLMFYSHTYYGAESRPLRVMAHDHGVPPRDFENSKLTRVWVKHHDKYFKDTVLRHHEPDQSFEYAKKDIFNEIQKPARDRGMKIYIRLLEASAGNGKKYIKNYDQVLTENVNGTPGDGPCWNNPDYRNWVYGTAEDIFENYRLDGIQYGAERTGPISRLLFNGDIPSCFCEYCVERNKSKGIDPGRAREGYTKLYQFIKQVEAGQAPKPDTVMVNVMRHLQEYPEILAWNYQWFQADEEIQKDMYQRIKKIQPQAIVGRHIDHQRSSWDLFYRSAITYGEMAEYADFIKPILYHDIYGPRLRWWVIDRYKDRMMNDLTPEQTLDLFYSWMGYSKPAQIELDDLEREGMGPEYVYDETKRCVESVAGKAQVIAGIGIDVPWHAPGGMQPYPSDPERLQKAVFKAMEAGADGLLASRDYDEMRHSSLIAFGDAVKTVTP